MRRYTVIVVKIAAVVSVLLVGGLVVCALIGVSLDLGFARSRIEAAASSALGRNIRIEGPIRIRLSLWPAVEIRKVRIVRFTSDHSRFLRLTIGRIYLRTVLLPLLKRNFRIRKIEVSDVVLVLQHGGRAPPERETAGGSKRGHGGGKTWRLTLSGPISLKNISLVCLKEGLGKVLTLHFKACDGDISPDHPADLHLEGVFRSYPLELRVKGGPLPAQAGRTFPLEIRGFLGDLHVRLSGRISWPLTEGEIILDAKVWGQRLEALGRLFGRCFPPVGPYLLEVRFRSTRQTYDLPFVRLEIGKSRMMGQGRFSVIRGKPVLRVDLGSDLIRLDDFLTKDFPPKSSKTRLDVIRPSQPDASRMDNLDVFLPSLREFLKRWDAACQIRVKRVVWGRDDLGGAFVKLKVGDGHVRVDPLRIRLPGGGIDIRADIQPKHQAIAMDLRARVDRFDWGVIARWARPNTKMGGILSLDVALRSTTEDVRHLMRKASGHFDFMLVPRNFSAGVIDLWAVNLLSAIFEKTKEKEKSKIHCVVVRLALKDGLMKERALYMDTSRMRISGRATIDFKNRRVCILLVPRSKRPEYFSLAVPLRVRGTFDDFKVSVSKVRMMESAFSFITSPLHVPIRRLFGGNVPANGRKACEEAWRHRREKGKRSP